jgi:triosephosphate isomerase
MSLPDPARRLAPAVVGVSLKMYFSQERTLDYARAVARIAAGHEAVLSGAVDLVVLPSFPALVPVVDILAGTGALVGAQDVFWEDRGAYTGEVSASDLREIGCDFVEIGHAERKRIFGETDEMVAGKLAAASRNALTPLLCVGEKAEGSPESAAADCIAQLESALAVARADGGVPSLVVGYEPEWAIGAAQAASPAHISAVCTIMRSWLEAQSDLGDCRIIYGGSAGPGLIDLLGPAVDGLFLGRFAHDPAALASVLDEALAQQRAA